MAAVHSLLEMVADKKKQFALALGEITELPERHFKINEVATLFAVSAATIALHELKGGVLSGRLPFPELSGAMAKAVVPQGVRKSTLHEIWGRYKKFRSQDDFGWGDLRKIANYLNIDTVELVPVFEEVDTCRHEFARQLASIASGEAIDATLFTSEDSKSAGVKMDSGAPEVSSPAGEEADTPSINPAPSNAGASAALPKKVSATKRRPSPRNKKQRERLFPKGAREEGVADPKTGP